MNSNIETAVEMVRQYDDMFEIVSKVEAKCDQYKTRYEFQMEQKNHDLVATLNKEWNQYIDLLKSARAALQTAQTNMREALAPLSADEKQEAKRIARWSHTPAGSARRNALHAEYKVSTYPH